MNGSSSVSLDKFRSGSIMKGYTLVKFRGKARIIFLVETYLSIDESFNSFLTSACTAKSYRYKYLLPTKDNLSLLKDTNCKPIQ